MLAQPPRGSAEPGGSTIAEPERANDIGRSLAYRRDAALLGILHKLHLERLLAANDNPERRRVLALIAARILHPAFKLAIARKFRTDSIAALRVGKLLGPEISPTFVARAPRCCGSGANGLKERVCAAQGVADTGASRYRSGLREYGPRPRADGRLQQEADEISGLAASFKQVGAIETPVELAHQTVEGPGLLDAFLRPGR